jgi:hypothetical protein
MGRIGPIWPIGPILLLAGHLSAQELTHTVLDAGGGTSTGGTITNDATLGGIGGEMHDTAPLIARPGFAGQLWDAVSLDIAPQPAAMSESSTLQLAAHFTGDDATTLPTSAGLTWETASLFLSVDATGLAASSTLPGDQAATVTASSGDLTGSAEISLFDLTPDDYGPFAADGLDDAWQWFYFASDPASGAPGSDPDSDGQDNALEFLAGTTPLDGSSFLQLWIEPEPFQPSVRQLFFTPYRADRTYTWEYSTNLQPAWQPVIGDPPDPRPTGEARATDEVADEARKFYRLQIESISPP